MVLAHTSKVVLGCVAFGIFWVLAVFPSVPFMPVGRTAGSLLGAMLMVLFRVISPEDAYAAIDLPIIGLLFGTMVVSIFLERADMFKYLGNLLQWKSRGPKDLLFRVCIVSAIASALFTNDTCCVVLTEFILKVARQNNLPPQPFLLALATSSNIGSAATPIGNPQNLVLLALDFTDAQACLEKVSYSLLIFFCGMFITVDGFNKTGIPNTMWELVEPYSRIDSARGVALLGLVILILSNVASNVPTVLLLGTRVAASAAAISPASERKAWLILAYVSTVAGNLTLLGSAANLIVCEQARRAQFFGYNLSFWSHLRFGVPSTIIVTAIGLLIVSSY
ncbi:unnamed protein product [Triticum turgidum subsp. durum]|uniref:Citrate transporter-like domain-containing protein n=1 Tax=Triticum turgidum subsp. durum TaxID=4567 RepID=A0A9R0T9Z6_TRITD|nr:unnamed protein product [Triticum turgidum subsp. durum]